MPRVSVRQALLADITKALALSIMEDDDDELLELLDAEAKEFAEESIEDLFDLLIRVECSRYLTVRAMGPRSRAFRLEVFQELPENEFRSIARMSKSSFNHVVELIAGHSVFSNNSTCEQAEVWQQLAVALDRFGNYGNGVSVSRTHHLWGIGKGTCDLYTARVMIALESLAPTYVRWPDEQERRQISRRLKPLGFGGCVGFIDGTTIPLAQKPAVDGECFFDRKHRYSINAQVICDDRRKILMFYSGWTGSSADSSVYQEMQFAQDEVKTAFFSPGQYLVADSAYPADHIHGTIIPAYRSNSKGNDKEDFNTCLAHARVVNEHTIGVLKGRWSCLRELRVQIKVASDMKRALMWMQSCVVLHNILISLRDDWPDEYESSDGESSDDDEDDDSDSDSDQDPYVFRRRLKPKVLDAGRAPGGILWYRAHQETM